jgi:hypothetical protein
MVSFLLLMVFMHNMQEVGSQWGQVLEGSGSARLGSGLVISSGDEVLELVFRGGHDWGQVLSYLLEMKSWSWFSEALSNLFTNWTKPLKTSSRTSSPEGMTRPDPNHDPL